MNDQQLNESNVPEVSDEAVGRRLFLLTTGKWSGAAIAAVVAGSWFGTAPRAEAGAWINRRGGGGVGGWVNRGGGGGGWINRRGGGGAWVNRF